METYSIQSSTSNKQQMIEPINSIIDLISDTLDTIAVIASHGDQWPKKLQEVTQAIALIRKVGNENFDTPNKFSSTHN